MLHNIDSIQDLIGTPKLSGIADKSYQLLLSQAFVKEAEVSRPWAGSVSTNGSVLEDGGY
jgi:hypothetical protein